MAYKRAWITDLNNWTPDRKGSPAQRCPKGLLREVLRQDRRIGPQAVDAAMQAIDNGETFTTRDALYWRT